MLSQIKETGIHAIIQKIAADAEQHSSERLARKKSDVDREFDGKKAIYDDEHSKRRDIHMNHNKHEYALMLDRLNSRYYHELLTFRHALIDDIFDMAAAKLADSSKQEFSDMFAAAVHRLEGEFILYIGEFSQGRLDAKTVEEVQKENDGLKISLSPDAIQGKSGFLLRDDRVEYNCLFEDLIEDKKNEQANMILKEVFGEMPLMM